MRSLLYFVTAVLIAGTLICFAQAAAAQSHRHDQTSEAAIRAVLNAQRDAWNPAISKAIWTDTIVRTTLFLFPAIASIADGRPFWIAIRKVMTRARRWAC